MKIFATICLICIVFRYIYVIYTEYISFNDGSSGESAKLNFNQWRDLYFVNPSRYNLDEIVKASRYNLDGIRNCHLTFLNKVNTGWKYDEYKKIIITFSFIDYIKFLIFVGSIREQKKKDKDTQNNINQNESLKYILEVTQSDIEKLREQSQNEIEKAKNVLEESKSSGKVTPSMIDALEYELRKNKWKEEYK